MSTQLVDGYLGVYKDLAAIYHQNKPTTMYAVCDSTRQSLALFLLTPGVFRDAYYFASQMSFQRIYLFTPTMNDLMKSDVVRLVIELRRIKAKVTLVYPGPVKYTTLPGYLVRVQNYHNPFMDDLLPDFKVYYDLLTYDTSLIGVDPDMQSAIYSITALIRGVKHTFAPFISEVVIDAAYENPSSIPDWFHLPYRVPSFGGLSAFDVSNKYPNLCKHIVANDFTSSIEFQEATENKKINKAHHMKLVIS